LRVGGAGAKPSPERVHVVVAKRLDLRDDAPMARPRLRWAWGGVAAAALVAAALVVHVQGARAESSGWAIVEGPAVPEAADGLPLRAALARPGGEPLRVRAVVREHGFLLVIDDAQQLLELGVDPGGKPFSRVLASQVRVAPFVVDRERFAYVHPAAAGAAPGLDPADGPADLVLRDGDRDRVLVRSDRVTAFLGVRAGELLFVAEDAHGTPGLRAVDLAAPRSSEAAPAARCLTNCALGPAGARDPRFEALPATLEEAPW
jgi:hypothetical protein